ncbi:GNAT family N-acetyltransferase [Tropicibacter oceani]|uniref:N-acetyltransferase family protein n=1 Tax=Tropicibacter oceani TaxID=3058420 RepID=A0ABY8QMG1_9RHOB|nr:GNAT family N-acetyltransferase [Tropicibacter oceani]WGW05825.1 N-acetyltransferase family protein [Tropicibacter oceani]
MIIRPAREEDAAEIAAIWNEVIDNTAITFTTARKTAEGIGADIVHRGPLFQVAEIGGHLRGFATAFQFRGGPGYAYTYEHSIQLTPEARGQGAGRGLMTALEAALGDQGVHSLWAGISGENPGAVGFHRAVGFADVARLPEVGYKFGRWIDLVLMQKIL